jgi:hypothetical protein
VTTGRVDINFAAGRDLPPALSEGWVCGPVTARLRRQPLVAPPIDEDAISAVLAERAAGACPLVRLRPGQPGDEYPLAPWVLSPLPEWCEREGLAIAVDYGPSMGAAAWAEVVAFARSYPAVPIVLLGAALSRRVVPAALDAAVNLIIEASESTNPEDLYRLVVTYGRHRFALGNAGPAGGDGVLSSLSPADAEAVGGGVARGLDDGSWRRDHL